MYRNYSSTLKYTSIEECLFIFVIFHTVFSVSRAVRVVFLCARNLSYNRKTKTQALQKTQQMVSIRSITKESYTNIQFYIGDPPPREIIYQKWKHPHKRSILFSLLLCFFVYRIIFEGI